MMSNNPLPYEVWVEESLRNVIRLALDFISREGLPGEHHFFITFKTNADGVDIPNRLREEHPSEMTIVLQHQFSNLMVEEQAFSVTLSFGGKAESLYVPFSAIVSFADPAVNFGLQLKASADSPDTEGEPIAALDQNPPSAEIHDMDIEGTGIGTAGNGAGADTDAKSGEVITLDKFRKK